MVAPIDSIITAEEPYKSEYANFKTAFTLSSHSYVYLNGSILKCKRIGRQGRDLQVVDKFYITNKIPELNKALSHEPTCLINGKLVTDSLTSDDNTAQRLLDRLGGRSLPVARLGISAALSDMNNDADIIVALAKTKERDAICAHLSNDWLKRAVKHKLNKFPPEYSSDGKYEVQQLTTEATIKYQGESWKGAEKTDLIYTVVEKASRRPIAIISIGAIELEYVRKRVYSIKRALKDNAPVVNETTIEFETSGITKILLLNMIDHYDHHEKLHNVDKLRGFVARYPNQSVSWLDLFQFEAQNAKKGSKQVVTLMSEILALKRVSTSSEVEIPLYIETTGDHAGRVTSTLKSNARHYFTIKNRYVPAKPHDFNFPVLAVKIPDDNHNMQTYIGYVKFNVALLKNINEPADKFMVYTAQTEHRGAGYWAYNSFSLCDFIFPSFPLHENTQYDQKVEKGYQLVVSNAIYGKKFKDAGKVLQGQDGTTMEEAFGTVAKLVSTGIEIPGTTYSSELSLGFLPDTYSEYLELCAYDDKFEAVTDKHKTVMYTTSSFDEESLLDEMDDADYDDLLEEAYSDEEEYNGFDDEDYEEVGQTDSDEEEQYEEDYMDDEDDDAWQMQRMLWLQNHPNSDCITSSGENVYWFDIMHDMMKVDQPDNANNIQLLETIWNSMLSKMQGYTAQDVMSMMYEQLKPSDDTVSYEPTNATPNNDLTDDDDDLFADL